MKSAVARELHALIHSLTSHEKRYFRLYATFTGNRKQNNYLHLFDVLLPMAPYQDQALFESIQGTAYQNHLPSTVYHLNNLILRSLKSFHSEKSERSQIRELIESARILKEKALYPASLKLLRRAHKKAKHNQDFLALAEILELEKKLQFKTKIRNLNQAIDTKQKDSLYNLSQLKTEIELGSLLDKHYALRKQSYDVRERSKADRTRDLMAHAILKEAPEGFRSYLNFHVIHGHQHILDRKFDQAYIHFKACVEKWEEEAHFKKEFPAQYVIFLTEFLSACIYSKHWIQAEKVIAKITQVQVQHPEEEIDLLNQSLYTQLFYSLNSGNYEGGLRSIEFIEELLKRHPDGISLPRKINFYYNSTIFFFLNEEFSKALHWLSRIQIIPKSDLKQNLQDFARIFQIVIHYELGNYDLVEYLFRSTYRHYRSKRKLYRYEKIIFEYTKKLISAWEPRKLEELASSLYDSLWELARNPQGKEPAGLYELIFWLQAKVEGMSLREVYQKRVKERMVLVEEKEKGATAEEIRELEAKETGLSTDQAGT